MPTAMLLIPMAVDTTQNHLKPHKNAKLPKSLLFETKLHIFHCGEIQETVPVCAGVQRTASLSRIFKEQHREPWNHSGNSTCPSFPLYSIVLYWLLSTKYKRLNCPFSLSTRFPTHKLFCGSIVVAKS